MKTIKRICATPLLLGALAAFGQSEVPLNKREPLKISHAEPLYVDLIRDLGARKGEKEWNVGLGMTDQLNYDSYQMLVEYEFAPVNRLGVEFEVPVTLYSRAVNSEKTPSNRVESLKSAVQYTFLVHEKARLSAAIGYLNELELVDLDQVGRRHFQSGHVGRHHRPGPGHRPHLLDLPEDHLTGSGCQSGSSAVPAVSYHSPKTAPTQAGWRAGFASPG